MNENEHKSLCNRLSDVSGSLKGVSGLFNQLSEHACLETSELYGIGQLLSCLSDELVCLEDKLREDSKQSDADREEEA